MDRRRFLLTSLVGALATPLATWAQQIGGPTAKRIDCRASPLSWLH